MGASSASGQAFQTVPIVDLGRGGHDRAALALELREICHEVGFFVVVNHGIESAFVDAVFESMRQFFALPDEQKALIDKARSPHFRGWEAVGTEHTNNRPDFREQIDVWTEWPARRRSETPDFTRLLGPNQWMPDEIMPGQRELVLEWFDRLGSLADEILGLLSLGLGLDEGHLVTYFGDEPMSLTKLINYPPTPVGQAGVNAHHDAGFLTLLAAGTTPGLQIQNPDGEWIDVPIVPNSFVVNLGEILQSMTGNYFVATPHRVITSTARMSAAYFHGPSLEASLEPLRLDSSFADAVAASPRHAAAGFMTQRDETAAGVAAMQSRHRPSTYGEQLWNYFARSYPANMAEHHST